MEENYQKGCKSVKDSFNLNKFKKSIQTNTYR